MILTRNHEFESEIMILGPVIMFFAQNNEFQTNLEFCLNIIAFLINTHDCWTKIIIF